MLFAPAAPPTRRGIRSSGWSARAAQTPDLHGEAFSSAWRPAPRHAAARRLLSSTSDIVFAVDSVPPSSPSPASRSGSPRTVRDPRPAGDGFLLAGAVQRFHLLHYGLAGLVGLKMVWLGRQAADRDRSADRRLRAVAASLAPRPTTGGEAADEEWSARDPGAAGAVAPRRCRAGRPRR
jgi:hypothetical protein